MESKTEIKIVIQYIITLLSLVNNKSIIIQNKWRSRLLGMKPYLIVFSIIRIKLCLL